MKVWLLLYLASVISQICCLMSALLSFLLLFLYIFIPILSSPIPPEFPKPLLPQYHICCLLSSLFFDLSHSLYVSHISLIPSVLFINFWVRNHYVDLIQTGFKYKGLLLPRSHQLSLHRHPSTVNT